MHRYGKLLVILSAVAIAVAVVIGFVTIRSATSGISEEVARLDDSPQSEVRTLTTVTLAEGETRTIWVAKDVAGDPGCLVQDTAGAKTKVSRGNSTSSLSSGGSTYYSVGDFTAPKAGDYKFGCYEVASTFAPADVGDSSGKSIATGFGAVGLGLLGLLSLLVGAVLWFIGARRAKAARGGDDGTEAFTRMEREEGIV